MNETSEIAHAAARGAIAAMAMTGMRAFTVDLGIVEQTPPQAIIRQRARGLIRQVPRRRRRAAVELAHWGYGALGGAIFGMLPEPIRRRRRWVGPIYGLLLWLGGQAFVSVLLGVLLFRHAHLRLRARGLAPDTQRARSEGAGPSLVA